MIAEGSLRFAVYMCAHDSELQASGNISSALRDARSYYESWFSGQFGFDSKDREALEIVALQRCCTAVRGPSRWPSQ